MNDMLFGRSLENNNNNDDPRLNQIQKDLKNKIQKAKSIALVLQTNHYSQDILKMCSAGQLNFPDFCGQVNYIEQFWKTYLKNQLSFALIKELSQRTSQLKELVKQIQNTQQEYFRLYKIKNRKKNRRLAVQIQKKYQCPFDKCYKVYGSDVSLNLHIKIKHNGGNKTDRQKLAQQICAAQLNGTAMPQMSLNLPPGFLQDFKKSQYMQKLPKIEQI